MQFSVNWQKDVPASFLDVEVRIEMCKLRPRDFRRYEAGEPKHPMTVRTVIPGLRIRPLFNAVRGFMSTKWLLWTVLVCCSLVGVMVSTGGCKDDHTGVSGGAVNGGSGATAFVDLDKVAQDLGWKTKLQADMVTYQNQLQTDLKQLQQRYEAQVQQHLKDMIPPGTKEGEKYTLSPTQSQDFTNFVVNARQQLQQLDQKANQQYNAYHMLWMQQYRDALSPIVRQVAQDRRMNVVLVKNDTLMFADRSVDLTDAVVDAARKQPPTLTEVPMQRLEGPAEIRVNPTPAVSTQPSTRPAPAPAPAATTQP